ncbi:kinase-like domain-containing protein [Rhizophagus clarus]|uniref:Kinase-like domain-containing protein n=2 Tax=Rhizophagus clarus TaxID=94130 RepID=A0A8H3QHV1_9GLOM|nr:kinase-like domain-containing protein [Rhizophagus clarus]
MEYANKGNIRKCLTEIANTWEQKLYMLYKIIEGLNNIHKENLIHYDFHDGNILCIKYKETLYGVYISDYLGSYQNAKSYLKKGNIYGVIPFIAPEVLKGEVYTQASDIYSFSMIMWEFTSGIPPFIDRAHNLQLALSICEGERPEIIENTPRCYVDLMKKCWDEDPLKRPSASEVLDIIEKWVKLPYEKKIEDISKELKDNIMEFINVPIRYNNLITEYHPHACYISRLLDFTSEEINKILIESQRLKFFEKKEDADHEFFKLEKIAETYYRISQNKLKEKQIELDALQQKNSQFEQDIQNLRLQIKEFAEKENNNLDLANNLTKKLEQAQDQINKLNQELVDLQQKNLKFECDNQDLKLEQAIQIKESAKKESCLHTQIIQLQSEIYEKQASVSNLTEQLKQNKLISLEVKAQIDQLEKEKIDLENKLSQTKTSIQNLEEQKEQLEIKLNQSQYNYEQIEQKKIELHNMIIAGLLADQKFNTKLKAKLEKEIKQLELKLNNEKQIKEQLAQALRIKEDEISELEQALITLDNERIKKLKDKKDELIEIEKELINKLSSGENTKEVHKEKEAKEKELDELKKELLRTDVNGKNRVLHQVDKFILFKADFLTLQESTIEKLQDCHDRSLSSNNKGDKYSKDFQNIFVKHDELLRLRLKNCYDSLMNIIKKNKELEVTLKINDILKLDSFNIDRYNIFKSAINSQTRTKLNSRMMAEDIKSLRKNLNELKAELKQKSKELNDLKKAVNSS